MYGIVRKIATKTGNDKNGKRWERVAFRIVVPDDEGDEGGQGAWYSVMVNTYTKEDLKEAAYAVKEGDKVEFSHEMNGEFRNITAISKCDDDTMFPPEAEQDAPRPAPQVQASPAKPHAPDKGYPKESAAQVKAGVALRFALDDWLAIQKIFYDGSMESLPEKKAYIKEWFDFYRDTMKDGE